ncbi:MAG: H(+)/Cl(-) exchange transporter ClcA [Candidatus Competibacteraceae bacterium]|nr:H(+)/Cl(-) exchange transporter ClcA [Candidatus Competibacteraceae bacterium]
MSDETQNEITPSVVSSEVRDFVRAHERRRRQFPRAALVGLLAGLLAVAFRYALDGADKLRDSLIALGHSYPAWGFLIPIAFGALGSGISVFLVQRFAPEASGSGIPHLKAVLHRLRRMAWRRILLVKFCSGVFSIGGGLALGREGPTIQMGGAIGQMVSQWFKSTARERQTLIAAGAGAGLAAAFNAPLSGVIFVLEEVQRDFSPTVFTATFVACVIADVVARLLSGQLPAFHVDYHPLASLESLPVFLVLGLLAGVLGVAFNRALLASLRLFARAGHWPRGVTGAIVGAGVGWVGWFLPQALGSGHYLVEQTLAGQGTISFLLLFFALRFGLTMFSYGTGAAGGIFAPLLVLGAQIGLLTGLVAGHFFPSAAPEPTMFAVVGMAAYFTAIVRAPLTGIVLIVEMTESYSLMLPLCVACFCAYAIADLLGDKPIYEALLERDLLRSQDVPKLESNLLLELLVQHGAPFENRRIGNLMLPAGCLIITVKRSMYSHVAEPGMALQAGDRITVVVSPQAAAAVALLREGVSNRFVHHTP